MVLLVSVIVPVVLLVCRPSSVVTLPAASVIVVLAIVRLLAVVVAIPSVPGLVIAIQLKLALAGPVIRMPSAVVVRMVPPDATAPVPETFRLPVVPVAFIRMPLLG